MARTVNKKVPKVSPIPKVKVTNPAAVSNQTVLNPNTNSIFGRYNTANDNNNAAKFLTPTSNLSTKKILTSVKGEPTNTVNQGTVNSFTISYHTNTGALETFIFSLMPAMENSLRGNNNGLAVPEVKPGISFRTDINTKKMSIPGGPPVFQSLGIDKTIIQLTGALIGNEYIPSTNNFVSNTNVLGNQIYDTAAFNNQNKYRFNASRAAIHIDTNIAQQGRPVIFNINSDSHAVDLSIKLNIRCLIQSYRYLGRYSDKFFIAFDLVILDYMDKEALQSKFRGGYNANNKYK